MDDKVEIKSSVRVNAYPVIVHAVEMGLSYGWRRFFKHRDKDTVHEDEAEAIVDHLTEHVMNEICEVLNFDTPEENSA